MKSKLIALRISSELLNQIKELAAIDRRTFSAYMRLALEDHVKAKNKEKK